MLKQTHQALQQANVDINAIMAKDRDSNSIPGIGGDYDGNVCWSGKRLLLARKYRKTGKLRVNAKSKRGRGQSGPLMAPWM